MFSGTFAIADGTDDRIAKKPAVFKVEILSNEINEANSINNNGAIQSAKRKKEQQNRYYLLV
jgi:hypothetical protein